MEFELLSELKNIEIIAVNLSIRELEALRTEYGGRRWRKLKATAMVRMADGEVGRAEIHWYEAHGVGKRRMKVKRLLD